MKAIRKYGLREQPHIEEFINYLERGQQIIRYPDRWAKRTRESPYLTQLDNNGLIEMEQQQEKAMKEALIEKYVRR